MFSEQLADGKKILLPFITGGMPKWSETLLAIQNAGADGVELGIPFSDAIMDGPVICEANDKALADGTTPDYLLKETHKLKLEIPTIAMTYSNIAFRAGLANFAESLSQNGFSGAILADMAYEVAGDWLEAGKKANISTILLAAPTASNKRLKQITQFSTGFIYAVGLSGVTGEREKLSQSATKIAADLKKLTNLPVLVGVGISTPQQAAEACEVADGVIVGSALVRLLLEEKSPKKVEKLVAGFRKALN